MEELLLIKLIKESNHLDKNFKKNQKKDYKR